MPQIDMNVKVGKGFECGPYSIIQSGVEIGDNVIIGSHAVIKSGTIIEDGVFIDDFCICSGNARIGAGSQIRYQSIIARNVEIGENVFFCAGVKTAYLTHERQASTLKLRIGNNCFLGDNATVLSGVQILEGCVIGAHSLVTKNCDAPYSVYFGTPAKYVRGLSHEERRRAGQL